MRCSLLPLILLCISTKPQKAACNFSQCNQFDYWVGEWNVYDTLGNLVGENHIIKQYENCVIQEN